MSEEIVQVGINGKWTLNLPKHREMALPWEHWEYDRLAAMYTAIRPDDLVVDVGAENGDLSALFTMWSGRAPVLIEPSVPYWPRMKQIFEVNGLPSPDRSFVGFASTETTPDHSVSIGWPSAALGPLIGEEDEGYGFRHLNEQSGVLPQVRIDDLDIAPDVITMDVEGAEFSVLLGASEVLENHRPVVFVSVHPEFIQQRYNKTKDDVLRHVKACGYTTTYLGFDHEEHFMFKPIP